MSLSTSFMDRIGELYRSFIQHDAGQPDRIKRYRNIEPDSAYYIAMMIRIQQSKHILEIGTSTGYSTLWMADAAHVTGGKITTLEIDPSRTAQAQRYAQELELDQCIQFWCGDARDFLHQEQQLYDLILLDAERDAYVDYWPDLQRLLHPHGGVLIVDNVISHAAEVKSFITEVKQDSRFMCNTIAFGAGLFIVTYKS
ncbi:O-methyltransferase [Acinetobacter rudis]|uniref:Class I SAM-dependent methyltransferase n=1 Tax=Acinetobacter rudis TaxID=632955 RepID=A0AAW8J517_9GAMM|nr:class I SAM-dependent methyltransferase [Acinetobacter rudis]MDQ8934793.1 class I SAM-dependent methyltransferase [Acinetobacter rudis]MDQ8951458.1 class I SAM-dependent methyltransferase [Acinetobacter rudis]MDQ9017126.1 class I SAM-dependent methyltransferase [Acinetobacter rudis]